MSEASFASLGPTLLARKGGAKPAMRPQLAPLPELVAEEQLEDLGWNDMGNEDEPLVTAPQSSADVVPFGTALPHNAANEAGDFGADSPLVHRQQPQLAERILAEASIEPQTVTLKESPVPAKATKKAKPSVSKGKSNSARRAAFTLRLDTDRHLKLRLAATMQGVSAQALVTEALDAMLSEIEDLDALVQRMSGQMKHN